MTNWSKVSFGLSGWSTGVAGAGARSGATARRVRAGAASGAGLGGEMSRGGGRGGAGERCDVDGTVEDVARDALEERAVAIGDPRAQLVGRGEDQRGAGELDGPQGLEPDRVGRIGDRAAHLGVDALPGVVELRLHGRGDRLLPRGVSRLGRGGAPPGGGRAPEAGAYLAPA